MRRRLWTALVATTAVVTIAGCTQEGTPTPVPPAPTSSDTPSSPRPVEAVQPAGTPEVVASGLTSPWSVVRLESGSSLVSERDSALIKEVAADGTVRVVGEVAGVARGGEGGLLGIEALPEGDGTWLYAYFTSASDNRIVRFELVGEPGGYTLGDPTDILTGLERAAFHNGGRIKIGPDGMLYATVGDAGLPDSAQDEASQNGKILRMTPDGAVPEDNPFPGSLVYSLGHRNPQGLAWDDAGRLWSSEFGQNTWDELNLIEPGSNYGWPVVEGIADNDDFANPVYQWPTSEASPSGLAQVSGTLFMAALRGERLWAVYPGATVEAVDWFAGEYGRLRDALAGPDGSLWVLTNNTDGRGNPREGDDKLLQIRLEPLREG